MRRSISLLGLGLMLTLGMISFKKSANSLEVIKTDAGRVSGVLNATGDVYAFKGIPFAAPPVGDLRWKEPQPVKSWEGVRKCESFGPVLCRHNLNPSVCGRKNSSFRRNR